MLLKERLTDPSKEQLNKALGLVEKEHHLIAFMYKADKQKYGKLLEEMEMTSCKRKILFRRRINTGVSTAIFLMLKME